VGNGTEDRAPLADAGGDSGKMLRDEVRSLDLHWTPTASPGILDSTTIRRHEENLQAGAIAELALTNREMVRENADLRRENIQYRQEWGEGSRKKSGKTNRNAVKEEWETGGEGPSTLGRRGPELRPKLKAISNQTRIRTRPGGTTVITWVGDPWTIDGDVLLVVTDWELNILNSKFRDQLEGRVGGGYQAELRLIRNQDKGAPVVTSGGNTPYRFIMHLPARNIRPGEEIFSYQRVITRWLEAGIRSAVDHGSRRTVICNTAIWPEGLDWRDAEKTILAVERHMYENAPEKEPCEIVQVTLPGQDSERKAEMMDKLRKVTGGPRTRGREETRPGEGGLTQRIMAPNADMAEDEPGGERVVGRETERITGGPHNAAAPPSGSSEAAPPARESRGTPGYQPIPARRSSLPAQGGGVQPRREESRQLGPSTVQEVGPGRPEGCTEDDNI